jgi:hypothetical protein
MKIRNKKTIIIPSALAIALGITYFQSTNNSEISYIDRVRNTHQHIINVVKTEGCGIFKGAKTEMKIHAVEDKPKNQSFITHRNELQKYVETDPVAQEVRAVVYSCMRQIMKENLTPLELASLYPVARDLSQEDEYIDPLDIPEGDLDEEGPVREAKPSQLLRQMRGAGDIHNEGMIDEDEDDVPAHVRDRRRRTSQRVRSRARGRGYEPANESGTLAVINAHLSQINDTADQLIDLREKAFKLAGKIDATATNNSPRISVMPANKVLVHKTNKDQMIIEPNKSLSNSIATQKYVYYVEEKILANFFNGSVGYLSQAANYVRNWFGKEDSDVDGDGFMGNICLDCVEEGKYLPLINQGSFVTMASFKPWVVFTDDTFTEYDVPGIYMADFGVTFGGKSSIAFDATGTKVRGLSASSTLYNMDEIYLPERPIKKGPKAGEMRLTAAAKKFVRYLEDGEHNGYAINEDLDVSSATINVGVQLKGWMSSRAITVMIKAQADGQYELPQFDGTKKTQWLIYNVDYR